MKKTIFKKICIECGKEFEVDEYHKRRKTCSNICLKKRTTPNEARKKHISQCRKNYLKTHKHNWSVYKHQESDPEKKFRRILQTTNIQFVQYYIPSNIERCFELDFADLKNLFAFEINGNQHYVDGKLGPYYQERHDILEKAGWKVFEIPCSLCYKTNFIKEFLEKTYQNIDDGINFLNEAQHNVIKRKEFKKQQQLLVNQKRKDDVEKLKKDRIKIIREENKKRGWINQLAIKLNVSHTQVRRLIKQLTPDLL